MSSSEEYLDSLLDSILGGGKPDGEEEAVSGAEGGDNQAALSDGGKAMSSEEIEEMLMSMGTLGGSEQEAQEQAGSEAEDMEAMLAFMNEHNAGGTASGSEETETTLDDLGMDEGMGAADFAPEGKEAEEGMTGVSDELSLDDLDLGESSGDDGLVDDLSLDSLDLGVSSVDEGAMDDLSLDDLSFGESGVDDGLLDELSLDDLDLGDGGSDAAMADFALEEPDGGESMTSGLDELSLDDLDLGESGVDDGLMDDLSLDDLDLGDGGSDAAMSDFALEEPDGGESMTSGLDELSLDDLDLGESGGDMTLDELSLDDLDLGEGSDEGALGDLALEETGGTNDEMDGLMSEEDIDRLLNGNLSDEEGGTADFALEETGESDEDLSALLAGMGHDEDLSEINDLLEGADQGVSPDDDMLAMLEGADDGGDSSFDFFENDEAAKEAESIRELTPEEIEARESGGKSKKEKKKRKKLFGKKKKESGEEAAAEEAGGELEALLAETTEQEPEAEEAEEKKPGFFARLMNFLLESDEEDEDPLAAEVLADSAGETGTVTDENKALLEELKEEDKKGKKKKDKKKKEEEEADLFAPPEKKLSKKKVITVFVFCGTIAACIVLLVSFLPNYTEKREAHVAYDHQDYAQVYDLLYGKELDEQDEVLFQRSNLILQMNRKLTSYENYGSLDMRLESLNALIGGVARYQAILPEAETYNVVGEVSDIYAQILDRLSADFGVSESDALEIIALEDDVAYSQRLEAIISGAVYSEDIPAGRQDVLPEEEEIIERIDGLESETEGEQPTDDMQTDVAPEEDMLPEEMMEVNADENAGEDMPTDENANEGAE